MTQKDEQGLISVIIPVGSRQSPMQKLYAEYEAALEALNRPYEVWFVLDGPQPEAEAALRGVQLSDPRVSVLRLSRAFGGATALMAAFERLRGEIVVTLPAFYQISAAGIAPLIAALDRADMVVAHRWPRAGSRFSHFRRGLFHGVISRVTGTPFRDLGCGARAFKRVVLEEVALYGDQHHFFAVLAARQGFRVEEIDVPQSSQDARAKTYGPRVYVRRVLDVATLLFLTRFTKKPLRFFGTIGVLTSVAGGALIAYMVVERIFFGVALAERPALLLASLLTVLGLQLLAIGLLGELIIFTHAKNIKEYQVAEVIESREPAAADSLSVQRAPQDAAATALGRAHPRH